MKAAVSPRSSAEWHTALSLLGRRQTHGVVGWRTGDTVVISTVTARRIGEHDDRTQAKAAEGARARSRQARLGTELSPTSSPLDPRSAAHINHVALAPAAPFISTHHHPNPSLQQASRISRAEDSFCTYSQFVSETTPCPRTMSAEPDHTKPKVDLSK